MRIWLRAWRMAPTSCAREALLFACSTRRRSLGWGGTRRKLLTSSFLSPNTRLSYSSHVSLLVFQIAGRRGWVFPLVRNTQQLLSTGLDLGGLRLGATVYHGCWVVGGGGVFYLGAGAVFEGPGALDGPFVAASGWLRT